MNLGNASFRDLAGEKTIEKLNPFQGGGEKIEGAVVRAEKEK